MATVHVLIINGNVYVTFKHKNKTINPHVVHKLETFGQ